MLLQRDTLIIAIALGIAASIYIASFSDLTAVAAPLVVTSPFEQSQGGVDAPLHVGHL